VNLDFIVEHSVLGINPRVHLVLIHTHRLPTHSRLSDYAINTAVSPTCDRLAGLAFTSYARYPAQTGSQKKRRAVGQRCWVAGGACAAQAYILTYNTYYFICLMNKVQGPINDYECAKIQRGRKAIGQLELWVVSTRRLTFPVPHSTRTTHALPSTLPPRQRKFFPDVRKEGVDVHGSSRHDVGVPSSQLFLQLPHPYPRHRCHLRLADGHLQLRRPLQEVHVLEAVAAPQASLPTRYRVQGLGFRV